jgi:hypothetical protein
MIRLLLFLLLVPPASPGTGKENFYVTTHVEGDAGEFHQLRCHWTQQSIDTTVDLTATEYEILSGSLRSVAAMGDAFDGIGGTPDSWWDARSTAEKTGLLTAIRAAHRLPQP